MKRNRDIVAGLRGPTIMSARSECCNIIRAYTSPDRVRNVAAPTFHVLPRMRYRYLEFGVLV